MANQRLHSDAPKAAREARVHLQVTAGILLSHLTIAVAE
jgi:hypothetical protein